MRNVTDFKSATLVSVYESLLVLRFPQFPANLRAVTHNTCIILLLTTASYAPWLDVKLNSEEAPYTERISTTFSIKVALAWLG